MAATFNRGTEDKIVKLLNEHRERYGIEKEQIAERLGVSRITVWNWLNNATWPNSIERLRSFSSCCGLKMKIVFTNRSGEEYTL